MLTQLLGHQLRIRLEYRGSFLFSLLLHPLVMLLTLWMFQGIYSHHRLDSLLGYSLHQMVWYFGASHFFYYLVWNMVDKNISDRVLHGRMDQILVRPYSLLTWELAALLSEKLLSLAFELIPVWAFFTWICPPDFMTVRGFCQYFLFTGLAVLQFFFMSFCLGLLALRSGDASSANVLKFVVVNLFAGVSLPIVFLPAALQQLITVLPFHYLFHTPVSYLLGTAGPQPWAATLRTAGKQCVWIGAFLVFARFSYTRSVRHFQSVGG